MARLLQTPSLLLEAPCYGMRPRESPRCAVLGIIWILYGDELKSLSWQMVSDRVRKGDEIVV